ncbi:MAG: HAD family hydrolase [Hominimerdicola sp.]
MDFTKFGGIIFDLDGTLIKSNYVWSKIDEDFLGKRGITVPEDYFKIVSTMNFQQAAIYTNERFSLNENIDDICQEWFQGAVFEYTNKIPLVEGAGEFVRLLKQNNVKIALATASSKALYEPVLKRHGLYDYFDFFATTEQVKRGKGFPDVYELACGEIGEKPENCAVFEDIIEGIRGAKAGNFTAVACLNSHYHSDWDKLKAESDLSFSTYFELMCLDKK